MKKLILWVVSLVILALAWAALDDITTGSQPSFALEWSMVGGAVLWVVFLVARRRPRSDGG